MLYSKAKKFSCYHATPGKNAQVRQLGSVPHIDNCLSTPHSNTSLCCTLQSPRPSSIDFELLACRLCHKKISPPIPPPPSPPHGDQHPRHPRKNHLTNPPPPTSLTQSAKSSQDFTVALQTQKYPKKCPPSCHGHGPPHPKSLHRAEQPHPSNHHHSRPSPSRSPRG